MLSYFNAAAAALSLHFHFYYSWVSDGFETFICLNIYVPDFDESAYILWRR